MLMGDISEDKQLSGFPRVITLSIHVKVLEIQADYRNWSELEQQLLKRYVFDDLLQLSKRELMEWVELTGKGQNTLTLLQEFEK